jgi:hypothetical protein
MMKNLIEDIEKFELWIHAKLSIFVNNLNWILAKPLLKFVIRMQFFLNFVFFLLEVERNHYYSWYSKEMLMFMPLL